MSNNKHVPITSLRQKRIDRGLSQKELANSIGVSISTVAMIETGKRTPSLELAYNLAKFFGVKIEDLF